MIESSANRQGFHINIIDSQGVVIGDNTTVIQNFKENKPDLNNLPQADLLSVIRQASEGLRGWPSDIAGIHLERSEVREIVDWVLNADPKERLSMLLDQPGGGKTVVMHDVLVALENAGVATLAIKADTLSGIRNQSDLADRLGLPVPVEDCVKTLSSDSLVVVILDQIDALSLALSRDQATLDVVLTTLRRLRTLENVRIIASCRTFDLNNDPHLSTIKEDRKFPLQLLRKEQIQRALQIIGVNYEYLLPEHQQLLTVPLHLDVYVRVIRELPADSIAESYYTLQELYAALWRRRIEVIPPDRPSPAERSVAIYRLVDNMQSFQ